MRLLNLIANSLWILPLCIQYAVNSETTKISPYYDDSELRVVFTNVTPQWQPIAINTTTYHEFVCNSEFFIDNSKMIQYVAEVANLAVLLPRRFGKSTNLLMMKCFFEIPIDCVDKICKPVPNEQTQAYQIFQKGLLNTCSHNKIVKLKSDLQIKSTDTMKMMNTWPVLYITFQKMDDTEISNDLSTIYDYIISKIRMAYNDHYYLDYYFPKRYDTLYQQLQNQSPEEQFQLKLIKTALTELISMMRTYFKKEVLLLIDEYDSILNTLYLGEQPAPKHIKDKVVKLFGMLYGSILKGNHDILKVYITGIIPWKNAGMLTSLLYADTVTVIQDYPTKYYGISETDLQALYTHFTQKCQSLKESNDNLTEYYDGYLFGDSNMKRYNPISIANYFSTPKSTGESRLKAYWGGTGDATSTLAQFLKYSNFASSFLNLLLPSGIYEIRNFDRTLLSLNAMETISNSIQNAVSLPSDKWYIADNDDIDNVFLFLYATGYLTKHELSNSTNLLLQIPNREVREVLWENYVSIQTGKKHSQRKTLQFKNSLQQFAPILEEILKTDETDCTGLTTHFSMALHELPPFVENLHFYGSAAQIESILSGVVSWNCNRLTMEHQHSLRKLETSIDERAAGGRPNITVIFDNTRMTVFEIKSARLFDEAYIQAMKYVHLYFSRTEYSDIEQIKVVPFVVEKDKRVISNATNVTREKFDSVEKTNSEIRRDLNAILKRTDIAPKCSSTSIKTLDWTYWNWVAEPIHFNSCRSAVIKDCEGFITGDMAYFRTS